jgi:hypothetical protein
MVPGGKWGSAYGSSIFRYEALVMVSFEKK